MKFSMMGQEKGDLNVSIIYIFLLFADNTSNECQRSETIPCID